MRNIARTLLLAAAALVLLTASAPGVAAQDGGWVKVDDEPAPNFGAVEMFGDTHGIAAGSGGLFYTTDGGASWQEGSSDEVVSIGSFFSSLAYISFADADHAWVAGFSGQMWRTSDGGRSWRKQQTNTNAHFNSISAVSPDEAWAAAFGEGFSDVGPFEVPPSVLLHTTDGGATWQQAFRSSKYGVFQQVQFVDAQRGWLLATPCFPGQRIQDCNAFSDGAALLRTEDGGRTWLEVSLPAEAERRGSTQWFANGRGYLSAFECSNNPSSICEPAFFRSDDGGDTWTKIAQPVPDGMLGWRFVSPDRGYALTSTCDPNGNCTYTFVQTLDGGVTWSAIGPGPFVFGPSFDATSTKLLVPSSGGERPGGITLIDLATGSETAAVVPGHEPFSDVAFATRERGYAVNRTGLWVSDDGGASWRAGPAPVAAYEVSAPSRDVVWIAGADPACEQYCVAVYRSADGGRTWRAAERRFNSLGRGLDAVDAQTAWISADDGLWRTADAGNSWQLLNGESGPWEFIDRNFGFARSCESCDRQFPVTHDGGVTVEMRPLPYFPYPSFFLTPRIGWATGEIRDDAGGCGFCWAVYRTTDGARTWDEMWRSDREFISEVVFIDAAHGWGVQGRAGPDGGVGGVASTADGGRTWTTELTGVGGELIARDGRLWSVSSAQPVFGGGLYASRTTVWRRDIAGGITLPDSGDGTRAARHDVALALTLALAGAAALLAAGRRARRARG